MLRRRLRVALAGQLATSLLTGAGLAVVVLFVTSGRMSLSEAGAAAAAMVLLGGRLRGLAASGGGLYESALYLEDYVDFVAAAPRIEAARPTHAAQREPEVLEADSVTFTYPSRGQPSLSDASLVLRRGEVVALVGENGSGKTTFAKLLAGLYQPEAGAIKWDGQDTRAFDPATVHDRVAVIFQDFVRYQLSAHDNIAMGDHDEVRRPARRRAGGQRGGHPRGDRRSSAAATTRCWAPSTTAAATSPEASGSASRWRERSSATHRS